LFAARASGADEDLAATTGEIALSVVEHAAARGVRGIRVDPFRRFVLVLVVTQLAWLCVLGYLLAWLLG
jgi:hypothetical protein